ncbi:MAG: FecR family protein [Rhodocyclaceae bacterium]|nr:FecR family protein [Rhodocyclaceae bacterium]
MPSYSIFRLRNHALMMALAAAYPSISYAAGAASLDFATGSVRAINSTGAQRDLRKGSEVASGDAVVTGDGGRAQLRFSDGGMVSLQPGSEFRIDNYRFSGKEDGEERGFFSLLKGGLRSITGLVGRTNKNAYKVTTSVATIGIRGTEFTVAYLGNGGIAVSTGEGSIEVCNSAGCAIVPAGGSATVSGQNTRIESSGVKPRLDPAQPVADVQPVFSTAESRAESGLISPVSPPMLSGSGYKMAYAGSVNGFVSSGVTSSGDAVFSGSSELQSHSDGFYTYTASSIAGAFSADGVVGWGRWSTGAQSDSFSSYALKDFHYVVGVPTADLSAIGGLVATYQLTGFTLPTSTTGLVGQAPSGSLTADFGVGQASLNLKVPIGGTVIAMNPVMSISTSSPMFSYTSGPYINGFFAGANASHAALTYKVNSGSPAIGEVMGAAAFKR